MNCCFLRSCFYFQLVDAVTDAAAAFLAVPSMPLVMMVDGVGCFLDVIVSRKSVVQRYMHYQWAKLSRLVPRESWELRRIT